jgi:hypothetical protein
VRAETKASYCNSRVVANLREPFPVPDDLMGASDFTTPDGLLKYALRLVFIFLCNVPLLYGGIAVLPSCTDSYRLS